MVFNIICIIMIRIDRSVDIKLFQPITAEPWSSPWCQDAVPTVASFEQLEAKTSQVVCHVDLSILLWINNWNINMEWWYWYIYIYIYIYWWSPIVPTVLCLLMYVIYMCLSQVVEDGTGLNLTDPGPPGQRCRLSFFEVSLVGWF